MPVFLDELLTPDLRLVVWEITEDPSFFITSKKEVPQFSYKSKKRILEKLASQWLWLEYLNNNSLFDYDENGKPIQKEGCLSISHSNGFLCMLVSRNSLIEVGVDIQDLSPTLQKIKKRFCTENELNWAKNDLWKLGQLWTAKEAIYKCIDLKSVQWNKDIWLSRVENEVLGFEAKKDEYHYAVDIHFKKFGSFSLAYCWYSV